MRVIGSIPLSVVPYRMQLLRAVFEAVDLLSDPWASVSIFPSGEVVATERAIKQLKADEVGKRFLQTIKTDLTELSPVNYRIDTSGGRMEPTTLGKQLLNHVLDLALQHRILVLPQSAHTLDRFQRDVKLSVSSEQERQSYIKRFTIDPLTWIGMESFSMPRVRTVNLHPDIFNEGAWDTARYAVVLHEIGHVVHQHGGGGAVMLREEVEAWEWALKEAQVWTQGCHNVMALGLYTRVDNIASGMLPASNWDAFDRATVLIDHSRRAVAPSPVS